MNDEALAAIYQRAFGDNAQHWTAEDFAGLRADQNTLLMTSVNGAIIGRLVADEAEILTIFVAPEAQGKGEAQALLNSFITACKQAQIAQIFLEVAQGNARAIQFYKKYKFVELGIRKNYYTRKDGTKETARILRLSLQDAQ